MGSCVSHGVSPIGSEGREAHRRASLPLQRSPPLRATAAPSSSRESRGAGEKNVASSSELTAGRVRQYSASSGVVFKPVFPHRAEFPFAVRVTELSRVRELLQCLVGDPVAATQQQHAWNSAHTHISLAEADRGSREAPFHLERVSRNLSSIWIRAFNAVKLLFGFTDSDAQNELLDECEFRSALRFVYCFLEVQNIVDVSATVPTGSGGAATSPATAATFSPAVSVRDECAAKRSGGAGDDDSGDVAAVSRSFENFSADVSQSTREGHPHVSFAVSVSPATPPLLISPSHASLTSLPSPNVFRVPLSYYRSHVMPALGITGRGSLTLNGPRSPITEFTDVAPLPPTYEILQDPDTLFERIRELEGPNSAQGTRSPTNGGGATTTTSATERVQPAHLPSALVAAPPYCNEPSCRHDELCDVICRALLEAHVLRGHT